jgi:Zn-dependent M32 family carboxypeptidase
VGDPYPVYTQSYTTAAMFSHQVRRALRERFGALVTTPEAGAYLAEKLVADGTALSMDEKLARATGSPLSPDAYVAWLTAG